MLNWEWRHDNVLHLRDTIERLWWGASSNPSSLHHRRWNPYRSLQIPDRSHVHNSTCFWREKKGIRGGRWWATWSSLFWIEFKCMDEKCRRAGAEAELNCERAIGLVQQFAVNFRPWRQHLLFFHGVNSFLPGAPIHQTREVSLGLSKK